MKSKRSIRDKSRKKKKTKNYNKRKSRRKSRRKSLRKSRRKSLRKNQVQRGGMEPEPEPDPAPAPQLLPTSASPTPDEINQRLATTTASPADKDKRTKIEARKAALFAKKAARAAGAQATMSPNSALSAQGQANIGAAGGTQTGPDTPLEQAQRLMCLMDLNMHIQKNPDTDLFNDSSGFTLAHRLVTMSTELVKKHAELLNEYILPIVKDELGRGYTFSDDVVRHFLVFGDDLWNNEDNEDAKTNRDARQTRRMFTESYPTGTITGRNGVAIQDVNPVYLYLKFMSDAPNTTSGTAGGVDSRDPRDGPPGGQDEVRRDFQFALGDSDSGALQSASPEQPPIFYLMESLAFILLKCKKYLDDPFKGGITPLFTEQFGKHLLNLLLYSDNFEDLYEEEEDPYWEIFKNLTISFQFNAMSIIPHADKLWEQLWDALLEDQEKKEEEGEEEEEGDLENKVRLFSELIAAELNAPDTDTELSPSEAWNKLTDSVLSLNTQIITHTDATHRIARDKEVVGILAKRATEQEQTQYEINDLKIMLEQGGNSAEHEDTITALSLTNSKLLEAMDQLEAGHKIDIEGVTMEKTSLEAKLEESNDTREKEKRYVDDAGIRVRKAEEGRDSATKELGVVMASNMALQIGLDDSGAQISQAQEASMRHRIKGEARMARTKQLFEAKNNMLTGLDKELLEVRKIATRNAMFHNLKSEYLRVKYEAKQAGEGKGKDVTDVADAGTRYINEIVFDDDMMISQGERETKLMSGDTTDKHKIEWVVKRNVEKLFADLDNQVRRADNARRAHDLDSLDEAVNTALAPQATPPPSSGVVAERGPETKYVTFMIMADSIKGGRYRKGISESSTPAALVERRAGNLKMAKQMMANITSSREATDKEIIDRYGLTGDKATNAPLQDRIIAEIMTSFYHLKKGEQELSPTYYKMIVEVTEGENLATVRDRIAQRCQAAIYAKAQKESWDKVVDNPFKGEESEHAEITLTTEDDEEIDDHETISEVLTSPWYYTWPIRRTDTVEHVPYYWIPFGGEDNPGNCMTPEQLAKSREDKIDAITFVENY